MHYSVVFLLTLLALHPAQAREVQNHGLWFEHWLCDTFFAGYRAPNYTQKWDIPAAANPHHGHLPVNPKAIKYGSPIGLGDALRQFDISTQNESFILILGFWEQANPHTKRWVNLQAPTISPSQWQRLWHPITRTDLEKLDRVIKDNSLTIEQARAAAQAIKNQPPFNQAIITLNPKIDKSQRRLQCSLSFQAFFTLLCPTANRDRQPSPSLWGKAIPALPNSAPRQFSPPNPP
jgi:hypothetical protein